MNYAIIGCGLIGKKRLAGLPAGSKLCVACDSNLSRARELAAGVAGSCTTNDYRQAVADPKVEAVVVATVNTALGEITGAAIRAGKHVLVEKPAGTRVSELDKLLTLARKHRVCVRVGFNHRYHPAFLKAREIFKSGTLGEMMFVRARYGHGGRAGYDKEWRADPRLSGGGELIDQGIHLIDLAAWFLGKFTEVEGHATTLFWDMPVDDNAFLSLRTAKGQTAWLHASCTEWKNLFSFELYGRKAKLHVEGLGGSYGMERLSHYQMRPEMGTPDTVIYEYPHGDESWRLELAEFEKDVRAGRVPAPGLKEAREALAIVERIYAKAPARRAKRRK